MKVLFVRSGNHVPSPEPITQNQGDGLCKLGCKVQYFEIIGNGLKGYLKNIFLLRKRILKTKPDIIHAHYYFSGIVSTLAFSNRPTITSLMGSDVNNAGFLFLSILKVFVLFFWKKVIVKTEKMRQRLGISNVKVLPNGINLDLFRKIDQNDALNVLGWSKKKKNILFCSDPNRKEKNYGLAQKAIRSLTESYPKLDVHYLRGIPRDEVYLLYSGADVLLLTSHNEGSPNVIKEAMACCCPIVAVDVGDIRDVIGSTDGCYITSFEVKQVASKLKEALEYGKRTNGREKIMHLDSNQISKKIIEMYIEVIGIN